MKTLKLVTGILTLVFALMTGLQSCAVSAINSLGDLGETGGAAGTLVAILMIAGGITSIAARGSESKGGSAACVILFALAALLGFGFAGAYTDLKIWSAWCLAMALVHLWSFFKTKGKRMKEE